MKTKKIWTGKKFSGPEKSEDFSRKQKKTSKITPLVLATGLATGLAFLSGCDFSTSYVRENYYPRQTYIEPTPPPLFFFQPAPYPYFENREFHFQPRPYFNNNFPYRRGYRPYPYYQPNYFWVP